jgi:hypothetical protein
MRPSRRWTWIIILLVIVLLLLPMPIAERYTSPTQDGEYLLHPLRAYQFVLTAARAGRSSQLNTSGEALAAAKSAFEDTTMRPTKVELLFLPDGGTYTYRTRGGDVLTANDHGQFVWEVWGVDTATGDAGGTPDVIALIDYVTGKVLTSVG